MHFKHPRAKIRCKMTEASEREPAQPHKRSRHERCQYETRSSKKQERLEPTLQKIHKLRIGKKNHIEGRRKAQRKAFREKNIHMCDRHQGFNMKTAVLQEDREQTSNRFAQKQRGKTSLKPQRPEFTTLSATALCEYTQV